MSRKRPLLSIVIPTKDRYHYLKYLIKLLVKLNSEELEIVIQDNTAENKEISEFLKNISRPNIVYHYDKETLSVKENCDRAIKNSTGEFVCMLGDDDGVLPSVLEILQNAKDIEADVLLSLPCYYNWPDFYDPSIINLVSAVQFNKGNKKLVRVDVAKELKKCIANGFDSLYRMPKVYQAAVRKDFLDQIYKKCGTYSPGPSPDMANAVSLSILYPKCYMYNGPLFISGQCRGFGGGERIIGSKQLRKIEEVSFLPQNINLSWNSHLPPYWCADTIWPQSAIEAMKAFDYPLDNINYDKIIARFLFNHKSYWNDSCHYISNRLKFSWYLVQYAHRKLKSFVLHRSTYFLSFRKRLKRSHIKRGINNIIEASYYLGNAK